MKVNSNACFPGIRMGSSKGEPFTFNRELAINIAKGPRVKGPRLTNLLKLFYQEGEPSNSASARNVEDNNSRSRHDSLQVTFLARGWSSSVLHDETEINKEVAKYMAKSPKVEITMLVPRCDDEDKKEAKSHNINLVEAGEKTGFAEVDWLGWPPKELSMDVVVGHDIELGRHASIIKESRSPPCKWFQFVHRSHEDIAKHEENSNPKLTEANHKLEVQLCKSSDFVVTIGPRLHEAVCFYLRPYREGKHIFDFTPAILVDFSGLEQSQEELKHFRVVCFCSGDLEDFALQGVDIAVKAVAKVTDCHLLFVGAADGMQNKTKKRFVEYGINPKFFTIRSAIHTQERLKEVLLEADLAILPSREEGFGLTLLKALSAGLPILVSSNSGLGEALRGIPFGSDFVVSSDDPGTWTKAIENIRKKDRCTRLTQSKYLRHLYQERYSWEKQSETLIRKMISMKFGNDKDDHEDHHDDDEEETENLLTDVPIVTIHVQNFGSRTCKGATAKLVNESPSVNKEIAANGDSYCDTAAHIPKFSVNRVTEEIPQNGMNYFIVA